MRVVEGGEVPVISHYSLNVEGQRMAASHFRVDHFDFYPLVSLCHPPIHFSLESPTDRLDMLAAEPGKCVQVQ